MVLDNCFSSGYSKSKETPPIKKVRNGRTVIIVSEIKNFGYCLPVCSCSFLKNFKRKKITIIDAIIEVRNN